MSIYKNSVGAKNYIEALGALTLSGALQSLKVLNLLTFGQIINAVAVLSGTVITGAGATLKWSGGTTTAGGTLTEIAKITIPAGCTGAVLQIDNEDIVEAAERAGLLPFGFQSLVLEITGVSTNTIKSAIVIQPMHERVGLTPSCVSVLTP